VTWGVNKIVERRAGIQRGLQYAGRVAIAAGIEFPLHGGKVGATLRGGVLQCAWRSAACAACTSGLARSASFTRASSSSEPNKVHQLRGTSCSARKFCAAPPAPGADVVPAAAPRPCSGRPKAPAAGENSGPRRPRACAERAASRGKPCCARDLHSASPRGRAASGAGLPAVEFCGSSCDFGEFQDEHRQHQQYQHRRQQHAAHHHQGQRPLHLRADARGESRRYQARHRPRCTS
jgi:hypothetical protein